MPVLRDNLVEVPEFADFVPDASVGGGGGGGWTPGSPSAARSWVADDPPGVSIRREQDDSEALTNPLDPTSTTPMRFTLTRAGCKTDAALEVRVARAGGTTGPGEDCVTVTEPITMEASVTSKTFSGAVRDDELYEPRETLDMAVAANGNLYDPLGGAATAFLASDDPLEVAEVTWEGVNASDGQSNFS